jgi:hypothetical protein
MSRCDPQNLSGRGKPRQNVPLWQALFQRQDKQDSVFSSYIQEVPSEPTNPGAAVVPPSGSHEIWTNATNPVDVTKGLEASDNTAVPNALLSNGRTSNNSRAPFWRKVFRRAGNDDLTTPPNASSKLQASDGAPDIPSPSPNVTL